MTAPKRRRFGTGQLSQETWLLIVAFGIPVGVLWGMHKGREAAQEVVHAARPTDAEFCRGPLAELLRPDASYGQCVAAIDAAFREAYERYLDETDPGGDGSSGGSYRGMPFDG